MNFEQKLTSLLENEKFIEHSGTYSHDFLKNLFLENISNNLAIFIQKISTNLEEQEMWSFVNFLSSVYEDKKSKFSIKDTEKIGEFTKDGLYSISTHDDVYTSLLKLLSFLPVSKTELLDLSKYILENRKTYTILEALSFDLSELIPNEKIFLEVFLKTLNTPKGNYLGLAWHENFWEIIARHPDRKWFFDQLLIDESKVAADEFLAKGKKAGEALLNSLNNDQATITETIAFFRDFFTKLSPERTWYGYDSHKAKELLELVIIYAQKNNIPFTDELSFLFEERTFWQIESILAQYISESDILEFYKKMEFREMHLFRVYEAIKYGKREDKEKILERIEGLEGFQQKLEEVELARENGRKQSEASTKKFHEKIKREIRDWSNNTDDDKISPRLLEYFFRDDYNKLFSKKYRDAATKQLKRFLSWSLFNLNIPVYERYVEDSGKIDYRGGYWYSVEFFAKALETAKKLDINIKTRKIQSSIARGLLLYNTSDLSKLYEFLGRDISDTEADYILIALQPGHISNARYHLSGQNILPVFEKYEKIFLRKKHRGKVIELFKSIITDTEFDEWRRASPLDYIKGDLRKELLPWLKSHWENIVDKKRNYIETFDRWGLILKLNTILIQENDNEAIKWRFEQLGSAKVKSLSFNERRSGGSRELHFMGVSDIESELNFDRVLWKGLKHIDAKKYQKELLNIIKNGIKLLEEDEGEETTLFSNYAKYLINGVIGIFIDSTTISVRDTLDELNKINRISSGNAKYLFGFSLRNFQESKIKNLNEKEKTQLLYEITEGRSEDLSKDDEIKRLKKIIEERFDERLGDDNSDTKCTIIFEGKSDINYFIEAYNAFKYDPELRLENFSLRLVDGRSAEGVIQKIRWNGGWNLLENEILVGILDCDTAGIQALSNIIRTNLPEKEDLKFKMYIGKQENSKNRFACIIPITDDELLEKQVYLKSPKQLKEESPKRNLSIKNCFIKNPVFYTEHLFHGISVTINDILFEKDGGKVHAKEDVFGNNTGDSKKVGVSKDIRKVLSIKREELSDKELYRNFKYMLLSIQSIVENNFAQKSPE